MAKPAPVSALAISRRSLLSLLGAAGGTLALDSFARRRRNVFGLTTGIVGLGSRYGLDPRIAKGIAIMVSFQATYVIRKKVVFA